MPRIIYEPAECDPRCDVPDCHYTHEASWFVGDVSFETKREAEEYIRNLRGEPDPREQQ